MDGATFSSAHMRERDKALNEKHRKEIAAHEAKYDRLKHSAEDTLNRLSDLTNRTGHLVKALGFSDLQEALFVVDNAEHDTKYRDAWTRIEDLERALSRATDERVHLQAQLDDAIEERDFLQSKERELPASPSPSRRLLTAQLKALQSRYDELLDRKQRAAVIYKRDYNKWRDFKAFLFDTECKAKSKMEAEKDNEFRQNVFKRLSDNGKMLEEMGPLLYADDASYPYEDKNLYKEDKENQPKSTPALIPTTNFLPKSSQQPVVPILVSVPAGSLNSTTPTLSSKAHGSSPEQVPIPTHHRTSFPKAPFKRPETPFPEPLPSASLIKVAGLSKTVIHSPPLFSSKDIGSVLAPNSSDTEEDSLVGTSSPSSPTPLPKLSLSASHGRAPLASPSALKPRVERCSNLDSKRRSSRATPVLSLKQSPSTPTRPKTTSDPPRKVRRLGQEHVSPRPTPSPPVAKGKEKEKAPSSASAAANAKQTNDYSAFKGRGRYAKDSKEKTINETFAIDPKHNDGLDFQFDAVVRNKDERRKLHAGDCECCRDYYEGIGPLPKRLQPPLWRSPKKNATPSPARRKKGISRHRYNWARGGTPPGYWDIGFPDTQETKSINERAKEMHEKKRREIEAEAMRGEGRAYGWIYLDRILRRGQSGQILPNTVTELGESAFSRMSCAASIMKTRQNFGKCSVERCVLVCGALNFGGGHRCNRLKATSSSSTPYTRGKV
ncbi:DNA repair protein endonuclease SAE2/CtIP C-terminus-domain-containing protein [Armillaria fumosa]|nr:DNA repair protein endonuclease SAE2/CtIP C-terminus-domain-containing protein [Armillaria fumosa]